MQEVVLQFNIGNVRAYYMVMPSLRYQHSQSQMEHTRDITSSLLFHIEMDQISMDQESVDVFKIGHWYNCENISHRHRSYVYHLKVYIYSSTYNVMYDIRNLIFPSFSRWGHQNNNADGTHWTVQWMGRKSTRAHFSGSLPIIWNIENIDGSLYSARIYN